MALAVTGTPWKVWVTEAAFAVPMSAAAHVAMAKVEWRRMDFVLEMIILVVIQIGLID